MKDKGMITFLSGVVAALAIGWFVFPIALYETRRSRLTRESRRKRKAE